MQSPGIMEALSRYGKMVFNKKRLTYKIQLAKINRIKGSSLPAGFGSLLRQDSY